jgi:glutamate 5-kinase
VLAVVKVGTSSLYGDHGIDPVALERLAEQLRKARAQGHSVVVVSSGAVACGMARMGMDAASRGGRDIVELQALAAVGQPLLMAEYSAAFSSHGLVPAQVLVEPSDFTIRGTYLQVRDTVSKLLQWGCVPVVNENDPVSDSEIRFGENDTLAALVANLMAAELLLILTDTEGLFTGDPRLYEDTSLIEEVEAIDEEIQRMGGGPGSTLGTGGMASKLAAAKIATYSGIPVVLASFSEQDVVVRALAGERLGTYFRPRERRIPAKKLWVAFAARPQGVVFVDEGAERALRSSKSSLLHAGVVESSGLFKPGEVVEVRSHATGGLVAKGIVRFSSEEVARYKGRNSQALPNDVAPELIHVDDLVVLV